MECSESTESMRGPLHGALPIKGGRRGDEFLQVLGFSVPLLDAPFGFGARRPQFLLPDPFPVTPEMPLHRAVWLDLFDAAW